ncbi:ABC transporter substrate-binding protein [Brevibacterium sp. BRM-1]|uniref:ABC transporter substrate-binding protein n=1 Tax=Brevibacterium sp. BRM-1 TaxID=2999062 RepID=UPI00227DA5F9|nr:ABC transporter substrate-binding protein [Brevibacterium sp. BRM-1]WAL40237.1 ABC transporter substrate-binding protein [Brevibacterium sp. BRM-1]
MPLRTPRTPRPSPPPAVASRPARPGPARALSLRSGLAAAAALALALAAPLAGPTTASATTASGAASPSETQPTAQAQGDVIRVASKGFVDNFNPFTTQYALPIVMLRHTYEYLVGYDQEKGAPTAGIAEKWETSKDGKTWTFHIRPNMQWSDGEPITAADAAYTYNTMLKNPALAASNGEMVKDFAGVDATDDTTFVIRLRRPQAANPGLETAIVPEHVWSKQDPAKFANDKDVVGSGPFVISEYKPNQHITLTANPHFWRGAPKVKGVEFVNYSNPDASVQALKSNEVDLVSGLNPQQFESLQNQDGIATNLGQARRFVSLALNPGAADAKGKRYGTGNAALEDVKVRQAIRRGTDLDALRQQVMRDNAAPALGIIPATWKDWTLAPDDGVKLGYDVEAAKKLLDEAGWKEGEGGIRTKDGKKLSLRFLEDSESTTDQTTADYLVPWMKKIGIDLHVDATDADTQVDRIGKGDYDMYVSPWAVPPDPDYQLQINTCDSRPGEGGNGPTTQDFYCNPKFDALYDRQHAEQDQAKRQELVRQAQRIHYTDSAEIMLWYPKAAEAYRSDRFTGFGKQPTNDGSIVGQAGYWDYYLAEPVGEGSQQSGGMSPGLWIGVGIAVVCGAGGVLYFLRRRSTADERA